MLKTVSSSGSGATVGGVVYQGTWNASTNSPTLTSEVGTKGYYYVVSVAGSTNLDGETLWGVGDWAVFNGTAWQKVDGGDTSVVTSLTVTGLTGYMYANGSSAVTASTTIPASSVTAAGSTTQVQYNSSGAFAGSANLTFDGTTFNAPNSVITSSSSSDALRITQTGTGNSLLVEDSANPDSTPFVIDQNGSVAIGSTSAVERLNLVSDGRNFLQLTRASTDTLQSVVSFRKARGTNASPTIVQSSDVAGDVQFYGYDGATYISVATISSQVDGTPGTSSMPGRLTFNTTASGSSSSTERMRIANNGEIGIGSSNAAGQSVRLAKVITGSVNSYGLINAGTVQSDVTSNAYYFRSSVSTAASAFTLTGLTHYSTIQGTIGSGSTVTNQYGYLADSSLTGATNNYGFFGNIASGTGRYNLYMAGTADNYLGGNLGIGANAAGNTFVIAKTVTGAVTGRFIWATAAVASDVTTNAFGFATNISTQAASFTLGDLIHVYANQSTIGSGSTVTNQYGFYANSTLTGATNNYGFYGNIASGSGRYNLYMNGTAANYFAGDMQFDKTVTAGGTTGAQTINKNAGTVNFAAAATSLVVTDSRVTTSSIIICTVGTNDTTLKSVAAVAGAGSFTLYASAAATAETRVNFLIIN